MPSEFVVKDSGKREQFASGMVRDTEEGKLDFTRVLEGPMFDRWAEHLSKGAVKYPDNQDGTANWTKASGEAELRRFRKSALRHMRQWLRGDRDEDHAAAIFFNVNGAEYVLGRMQVEKAAAVDGLTATYWDGEPRKIWAALGLHWEKEAADARKLSPEQARAEGWDV